MSSLHVGDIASIAAAFTVDDVATDPTDVTLEVLRPSTSTPDSYEFGVDGEITNPAVGSYVGDIPIIEHGLHLYRFIGTGAAEGVEEGFFNVAQSEF